MVAMAVVSIFVGGSINPASVEPFALGLRATGVTSEMTG